MYSLSNSNNTDDLEWSSRSYIANLLSGLLYSRAAQLTRFQLIGVARSLCASWTSC